MKAARGEKNDCGHWPNQTAFNFKAAIELKS